MNQDFQTELAQLINKYGLDAQANTPDFMLAEIAVDAIASICGFVKVRDEYKRQQAQETPNIPETPEIPEKVKRVADAVAKALGGNCTIEFVKVEPPQRKRKNRKKKNHGKETKV